MGAIERLKKYCDDNNIAISNIEKNLGYGNSSLAKAKHLRDDRIVEICDYLGIPVSYLVSDLDGECQEFVIKDNSMSPAVIKGDTVLYDTDFEIADGMTYVFKIGSDLIYRQLKIAENGYYLVPLNPEYKAEFYSELPEVAGILKRLYRKF